MNPTTQQQPSQIFRKYYRPLEPILQKPKNRVYTATVLSFLTVSLFIWYAIRPTIQTILSLRREIRDSTAVNEQMETKIAALVEAQATYQDIVPRLGLIKEAVPETPDMVNLMVQLRNLANSVDATMSAANVVSIPLTIEKTKSVSIAQPSPSPSPVPGTQKQDKNATSPVTVTIQGSYESMKQFIQGVYAMRRIVTIVDITMLPYGTDTNTKRGETLTMTLKLNGYFADEP